MAMATLANLRNAAPRRGTVSLSDPPDQQPQVETRPLGPALPRRLLPHLVADLVAVSVGLGIYWEWSGRPPQMQSLFALGFVVVATMADAFHIRLERGYVEELVLAAKVAAVALLITAVGGFLFDRTLSRVLFLSLAVTLVVARPLAALLIDRLFGLVDPPTCVLAVCSQAEYDRLVTAITEHRSAAQFVHVSPVSLDPTRAGHGPADGASTIAERCDRLKPTMVVVGTEQLTNVSLRTDLARVNEQGVEVCSVTSIFQADFGIVPLTCLDSSWFLFELGPLHRLGYRFGRRVIDLVASVLFSAALALLLPVLALAIHIDSPGPIFFSQERVGQGGRSFRIHKLRTMRTDAEADGPQFAQHDDARVTRVGAWLRRCRLDELPQAINLFRGEMSLIGPRPERPEFVATFSEAIPFYDKRHIIKPGITGWAQVHEGYGGSREDTIRKLERDLYYVLRQSLGVDLRIMLATVGSVFSFAGR
jgi:exopolysaccharide biosynthesis polyprenyl glycosylphosphotransferase